MKSTDPALLVFFPLVIVFLSANTFTPPPVVLPNPRHQLRRQHQHQRQRFLRLNLVRCSRTGRSTCRHARNCNGSPALNLEMDRQVDSASITLQNDVSYHVLDAVQPAPVPSCARCLQLFTTARITPQTTDNDVKIRSTAVTNTE